MTDNTMIRPHLTTVHTDNNYNYFQYVSNFLNAEPQFYDIPFYNGEPDIRGLWRPIRSDTGILLVNAWFSRTIFTDVIIKNTVLSTQSSALKNLYDITDTDTGSPKILYLLGWDHSPLGVFVSLVPQAINNPNSIDIRIKVELRMDDSDKTGITNNCETQYYQFSMGFKGTPTDSLRIKAWSYLDKPYFESTTTITVHIEVNKGDDTGILHTINCQVIGIDQNTKYLKDVYGGDPDKWTYNQTSPGIFSLKYIKMGVVHGGGKPYLTSSVPTACQIPGARYQVGRYKHKAVAIECVPPKILFDSYCYDKAPTASPVPNCDLINSTSSECVKCKDSFFLDYHDNQCKPCSTNCYFCSDASKCNRCKEGYVFFDDGSGKQCTLFADLTDKADRVHNPILQIAHPKIPNPQPAYVESLIQTTVDGEPDSFKKTVEIDISDPGTSFFVSYNIIMKEDPSLLPSINPLYSHYDVTAWVTIPYQSDKTHLRQVKSVPFSTGSWEDKILTFNFLFFNLKTGPETLRIEFVAKHPADLVLTGSFLKRRDDEMCWVNVTSQQCFLCNTYKNQRNDYGTCASAPEGKIATRYIGYDLREGVSDCYWGQKVCYRYNSQNAAVECRNGFFLEEDYDPTYPLYKRCPHCNSNCKTCLKKADNCTSCRSNWYLKKTSDDPDPVSHNCVQCTVSNCLKCKDYTLECIECDSETTLESGKCVFPPPVCPEPCSSCLDTNTPISTNCTACKAHPEQNKRYFLHEDLCKESKKMEVRLSYQKELKRIEMTFIPPISALPQGLNCSLDFNKDKFEVMIPSSESSSQSKTKSEHANRKGLMNSALPLTSNGSLFLEVKFDDETIVDKETLEFTILEDFFFEVDSQDLASSVSNNFDSSSEQKDLLPASLVRADASEEPKILKIQPATGKPTSTQWLHFERGNFKLSNTISFYKDTKATEIVKTASAYSSVAVKTVMGMSLVTLSGSFSSLLKLTQHIEIILFFNLAYIPDNLRVFLKYFSENFYDLFFDPFKYVHTPDCSPKRNFHEQGLECYFLKNCGEVFMLSCLILLCKLIFKLLGLKWETFAKFNKYLDLSFLFLFFDSMLFDLLIFVGLDFASQRSGSQISSVSRALGAGLGLACLFMLVWTAILSFRQTKKQKIEDSGNSDMKNQSKQLFSNQPSIMDKKSIESPEMSPLRKKPFIQLSASSNKDFPDFSHKPKAVDIMEAEKSKPDLKPAPKGSLIKRLLTASPDHLFEEFKERKLLKFFRLFEQLKLLLCCVLLIVLYDQPIGQVFSITAVNLLFFAFSLVLRPWKKRWDNIKNLFISFSLTISMGLSSLFLEYEDNRPVFDSKSKYHMIGLIVMIILGVLMAVSALESLYLAIMTLKNAYKWLVKKYCSKSSKNKESAKEDRRKEGSKKSTIQPTPVSSQLRIKKTIVQKKRSSIFSPLQSRSSSPKKGFFNTIQPQTETLNPKPLPSSPGLKIKKKRKVRDIETPQADRSPTKNSKENLDDDVIDLKKRIYSTGPAAWPKSTGLKPKGDKSPLIRPPRIDPISADKESILNGVDSTPKSKVPMDPSSLLSLSKEVGEKVQPIWQENKKEELSFEDLEKTLKETENQLQLSPDQKDNDLQNLSINLKDFEKVEREV